MPNFPKNKGFKLPGMGSKETDTPGNFRKDQKVEDVGYCSDTESHMLPPGSSPLLKRQSMIDQVVPEYYKTSYTGNSWPMGKGKPKKDDTSETKTAEEKPVEEVKERESITVSQPGTESYSGESAQSKLGRSMTDDEKAWMNKEIERLGGVQQYRDHYKIGTKTETPGSEITISGYELEEEKKKK